MSNFQFIYLGVLEQGYSYEEFRKMLGNHINPTVGKYSLDKLETGEILYKLSSDKKLGVNEIMRIKHVLNLLLSPCFTYFDLNKSLELQEKYFVCFKGLQPDRNQNNDQFAEMIWRALTELDVNVNISYLNGYITITVSWDSTLPENIRKKIKAAIELTYPNSIVFEHPPLP